MLQKRSCNERTEHCLLTLEHRSACKYNDLKSNTTAGADPASKVRGRFQKRLVVKYHNGFATVREMKYTSQKCCYKAIYDKMAFVIALSRAQCD